MKRFILISMLLLAGVVNASTYYVDDANGSDSYTGTSSQPWKTIAKAQAEVTSGGNIIEVRNGSYGDFVDSTVVNRTNWLEWRASTGHIPIFRTILVGGTNSFKNKYVRFRGIKVERTNVQASFIVQALDVNYFELLSCTVHDYDMYNNKGISIEGSYFIVDRCEVYSERQPHSGVPASVFAGITVSSLKQSDKVGSVTNNYVHDFAGSGIKVNYESIVSIIGNHVCNQWPYWEGWITGQEWVHGAAISFDKSSNITIRRNVCHAAGDSGVIATNTAQGGVVNNNIVIENNVFYDCIGSHVRFLGTGCKFNNNTFSGMYEKVYPLTAVNYTRFLYGPTFSFDASYDGSLEIYNNVVVGYIWLSTDVTVAEGNNLLYTARVASSYALGKFPNSKVYTYSKVPSTPYVYDASLENTCFIDEAIDYNKPSGASPILPWNSKVRHLQLKANSPAINFGLYSKCPAGTSLGSIDTNGFLLDNGYPLRSETAYSAGAYEYASEPIYHSPVLVAIGNKSIAANSTLTCTLSATDEDVGDVLSFSVTNLPVGATLVGGTFTWKPGMMKIGTYLVTFWVNDGLHLDSETITITVTRPSHRGGWFGGWF